MKKLLSLYFLSIWCLSYSQTFVVADSLTKEPLAFATIVLDEKEMLYSNEKGVFTLKNHFENITVTYLGYNDFISNQQQLKDTISLSPKPFALEEVTITHDNTALQKIGYLKKAKPIRSLPLSPKNEFVVKVVPNSEYKNSYIDIIEFPLNKIKHYNQTDKLYKNAPAVVRVNIYTVKNELPNQKIFSSEPIKFIMSNKEMITVDISREMIQLPEEGLSFGIEMIGRINEQGEFVEENSYARPIITNQLSKDINTTTYIKGPIKGDTYEFYPLNKHLNEALMRDLKNYKSQDHNLAIGLMIRKP